MQRTTETPLRDQAMDITETLMAEVDDLGDGCAACIRTLSDWCAEHMERHWRMRELEAVNRMLWAARTDTEAVPVIAGAVAVVPEFGALLAAKTEGKRAA